jgi:hypothetical protein
LSWQRIPMDDRGRRKGEVVEFEFEEEERVLKLKW